jgi:hypothetical protein
VEQLEPGARGRRSTPPPRTCNREDDREFTRIWCGRRTFSPQDQVELLQSIR